MAAGERYSVEEPAADEKVAELVKYFSVGGVGKIFQVGEKPGWTLARSGIASGA